MTRQHTLLAALSLLLVVGCANTHQAPQHASTLPSGRDAATDEAALRAQLQARRAVQVARLREYAEAGVFPENNVQPGVVSMLLDSSGTPCAMANLVIRSGGEALIASLAEQDNGLQFGGLREGPLYAWILDSGLTQEETAFIQEPDMYIDELSPQAGEMQAIEVERLRVHFRAAALQLEMNQEASLELAVARRLAYRAR